MKHYHLIKNGDKIASFAFYGSALSFLHYKLQDQGNSKIEHYVILKNSTPLISATNYTNIYEENVT